MYTYNIDKVGNLDAPCDTPLILKNLKFKIKKTCIGAFRYKFVSRKI